MREIKFRAWIKFTDGLKKIEPIEIVYSSRKQFCRIPDDIPVTINTFNPKEVFLEQFTGLQDKNGRDIYEGDIIKKDFGNGELIGISTESDSYDFDNYVSLEIIGNIHENPDLLSSIKN